MNWWYRSIVISVLENKTNKIPPIINQWGKFLNIPLALSFKILLIITFSNYNLERLKRLKHILSIHISFYVFSMKKWLRNISSQLQQIFFVCKCFWRKVEVSTCQFLYLNNRVWHRTMIRLAVMLWKIF